MQVTKAAEYAVLSALYLAKVGEICDIGEIAESQKLSFPFTAKTLQKLAHAGILEAKRGRDGGYYLAKPAKKINLLEIIQAVEGPIAISDCLKGDTSCDAENCQLEPVWGQVQRIILEKLGSITLEDILRSGLGDEESIRSSKLPALSLKSKLSKPENPVIFCDFDGTISKQDVSDTIFTIWLGDKWAQIDQEWHDGKISMVELYEKCWSLVDASESELREFVDKVEIDPCFDALMAESHDSNIPLYLVSDGFDYFIERVMGRHNHFNLKHYSNHLSFDGEQMILKFDNQHSDCIQCANCKKAVMDKKREGADFVIYIGNGLSDRCAAEHADLVFAKDSLLEYCEDKGVPYVAYENFGEVIQYLKERAIFKSEGA